MSNLSYKRSKRVASEIYEIVAEVCHTELSDPRLVGIQLTGAEMTDDLQLVKIYYYIAGPTEDKKRCLKGLLSARGYLKRAVSDRLGLRFVPDIMFYFDDNIEKAEKMDELLKSLKKEE